MSIVTAGRTRLLIIALAAAAGVSACGPHSSPAAGAASSPAAGSAARPSSPATASAASAAAPSAATAAGAPAAAGINVCSLLSPAQASAINKVTYGTGTPKQLTAGWEECRYPNKGSADPVDIQALAIDVITFAGCFDEMKASDQGGTAISGLGDAAIGFEIGLLVRTGSTCVQIEGLTHAELMGNHSRDEAIAKIVLAALH
jgi:hypothetical protein